MDTRREHGQYWPGTRTGGGEAPTPEDNGKVDRVDLGTLAQDATAAEMRTAIRDLQNAMRPLATVLAAALCGIAMAQTAPWDELKGGAHVVTNEQDTAAMAKIVSATNALRESIEPKIALAETALQPGATNGIPETLSGHGTRLDALEEAAEDRPDMSLYALRSEVPPAVDLAPFATTVDVQGRLAEAASNTATQIEGLRTETAGKVAAATNGLPAKIAAVTNGIPAKIAAATNGLPEKIAAAESSASRAAREGTNYTDSVAGRLSARMQEMSMAFAASNTATRLSTPDGGTFQDATGVVWRVENFQVPGLFNFQAIVYFTNYVYMAETNALPAGINWRMWEGYDNGTWEIIAGESAGAENPEERYGEWVEFTNHVDAADMQDMNMFYYILQLEIAGEETELMTTESMDAPTVMIEWPMSNTNVVRTLVFARTNVTAKVMTPIDRVVFESTVPQTGGMTTNDVMSIAGDVVADATNNLAAKADVTLSERNVLSNWTIYRNGVDVTSQISNPPEYDDSYPVEMWYVENSHIDGETHQNTYVQFSKDAFELQWLATDTNNGYVDVAYTATRTNSHTLYVIGTQTNALLASAEFILSNATEIASLRSSVSAATDTNASQSAQIAQVEQTVNTWEGYWDGTNVIFEVTNYYGNTSGELSRLRIKEYRGNSWTNVWDEARKFEVFETNLLHAVSASNAACRAACSTNLAEGLSTRAPLAWGTYTDKGITNVVGNSVWMTSPETYFAGGTEYQRVAVGSGAVCVLVDNGALSKTVGEPGTFRFQDDGGTNFFGFAKSDSHTIGCRTDDISVEGTLITLRYDVIMGGQDVPIVYWREFIDSGAWTQLNNSDGTAADGSPYTVTWYQSGGSYYAAINCGENATGFFKAETSVAGDVVFETNMRFRAGGGIECTNTALNVMGVIKPVYNGTTVTWTWSVK